jgi:hypothetical protein
MIRAPLRPAKRLLALGLALGLFALGYWAGNRHQAADPSALEGVRISPREPVDLVIPDTVNDPRNWRLLLLASDAIEAIEQIPRLVELREAIQAGTTPPTTLLLSDQPMRLGAGLAQQDIHSLNLQPTAWQDVRRQLAGHATGPANRAQFFLLDPDSNLAAVFPSEMAPEAIARAIVQLVGVAHDP